MHRKVSAWARKVCDINLYIKRRFIMNLRHGTLFLLINVPCPKYSCRRFPGRDSDTRSQRSTVRFTRGHFIAYIVPVSFQNFRCKIWWQVWVSNLVGRILDIVPINIGVSNWELSYWFRVYSSCSNAIYIYLFNRYQTI